MAAEFQLGILRIDGTDLLDALVTSVFVLDHELRVEYLNAAAQTLVALSPNQALGSTASSIAPSPRSRSARITRGCCSRSRTSPSTGA